MLPLTKNNSVYLVADATSQALVQRADPSIVRSSFAKLSQVQRLTHLTRKPSWRTRIFLAMVVLPVALVGLYYGIFAAPIYVSESAFVVRMASPPSSNAFGSLLQNSGITRSQDDTFSVQEYMRSRDALGEIGKQLPLRAIFGSPDADWLTRFPRFWEYGSKEELYRYYADRVAVIHNDTTGITTLRTTAFHAREAYDLNTKLLALGGNLLSRLNDRARGDAVRFAIQEVRGAEDRVIEAQKTITNFRNKELMIDPNANSTSMAELISRLSAELATTNARLAETHKTTPDSSVIPFMTSRIAALENQISMERAKIAGSDTSIAPRIASYESLVLLREFANKALVSALDALEVARADARRQQLYLEVIVPPHLPDEAELPLGLKAIFITFLVTSFTYLLGWLLLTAIRDHDSG
ncbi:capsule biosynthesis protein [Mesorhizobium sp. NPDC059025]|uniref:capsule biosynthesis protein n=1 Tax=unclassified Mesorhizobium TaxID=325217 RepID=UPI00367079B1